MNTWIKRCAMVAFAAGLMAAGPIPASAATDDTSAAAEQSAEQLAELARLDRALAAVRALLALIVGADSPVPPGPPIVLPVPEAVPS